MPAFGSRLFRQWFGGFATGVSVVTLRDKEGRRAGLTVNSLTSVSLEPPLLLFCIAREARLYPLFKKSSRFALNLLSDGQEFLSRYFADPGHHAVPDNIWDKDKKGLPILRHTLGWMACKKTAVYRAGDHDIFVCRAEALHKRSGNLKPLVYFHSRYRKIED